MRVLLELCHVIITSLPIVVETSAVGISLIKGVKFVDEIGSGEVPLQLLSSNIQLQLNLSSVAVLMGANVAADVAQDKVYSTGSKCLTCRLTDPVCVYGSSWRPPSLVGTRAWRDAWRHCWSAPTPSTCSAAMTWPPSNYAEPSKMSSHWAQVRTLPLSLLLYAIIHSYTQGVPTIFYMQPTYR